MGFSFSHHRLKPVMNANLPQHPESAAALDILRGRLAVRALPEGAVCLDETGRPLWVRANKALRAHPTLMPAAWSRARVALTKAGLPQPPRKMPTSIYVAATESRTAFCDRVRGLIIG